MIRVARVVVPWLAVALGCAWLAYSQNAASNQTLLWQHRNLGKAFYENPTTGQQAVDQFKMALALVPNSARDRLNYGLALLKTGDLKNGMAELERVQKQDPKLPHTWFNLGISYKKLADFDKAQVEFEQMVKLAPDEPASHYQLGSLYKAKDQAEAAIREFVKARDLNPRLAAPHYQLYMLYRQAGRPEAAAELAAFEEMKKEQEGAAVPEDMEWSVYAEIYDPIDEPAPAPPPAPVYRTERIASGFDAASGGVVALELDGARPSLIAWSADHVALFRNGRTPVADSGLEGLRGVVSIAPGDFDNDGLPDLCVITKSGAALYRNANGHFEKKADLASGSFRKAVWLDFDHDYDEDLFLLGDDSRLMRNNGDAGFSDETARFPFVKGRALDAVPFDLEPDTPGFDLVVSYQDRSGVLYRDQLGGNYKAVPIDLPGTDRLTAKDLNHDGRTDLVTLINGTLMNGPRGWVRVNATGAVIRPYVPPAEADFAQDGRLAEASIARDGSLNLLRDAAPNYGNWIEVALEGVKNPKIPLGTKVEVKAGASYEKQTFQGIPLVFRLGAHARIDTIRIAWPNGMIQNEMDQAINRIAHVKEAPRLAGSCPMIFTWNGHGFGFLTDVLGVAPLGASSGDGRYFPVDNQEYVSIPGGKLEPRDGHYEIRLTEELREVSYIDQVKLMALDHPKDISVVTNERFKSPPFPEYRLFGAARKVYPTAARDSNGVDALPALLRQDQRYPDSFRRDSAGVAELHYLDLDFGSAAPDNRAALILNGWVDWADGSTFLAATQAHHDLIFPYLQVKDAAGNWKTVIEDMGMPSGKPKSMAVDLTGKFLSKSREVRIVTNLCLYWDEAYLIENSAAPPNRTTALPMESAALRFRGFSRPTIDPRRKQPETFDYASVSPTSMWNPTPGNYTRYGDVKTLLAEPDDMMTIMGSGDEIAMRFSAAGLPPLPAGWTRDFLLLVGGWAKDADANTAFSQSVLPLPFHSMTSYPYPPNEAYPQDPAHRSYVRDYLTRPALRLIRPLAPAAGT
ncbi:MAG TPA: FG-GAP-like repeat-containing protein [Bryobacteraceae bacterium]|nr:FG-GAP-like repeat-containing protein [Bryobacteraceae bacterium]